MNTGPLWLYHLLLEAKPGIPDLLPSSAPPLMPVPLALQVPPASAKQHGVNLSVPPAPFQQAGGYGQHGYSTGEGCPQRAEGWPGKA